MTSGRPRVESARFQLLESTVLSSHSVSNANLRPYSAVSFDTKSDTQVVLNKLRAGALSASDIPKNVAVSSMSHSPVSSLYHSLRSIYGPLLVKEGATTDPKLKEMISELEVGGGVQVDTHQLDPVC